MVTFKVSDMTCGHCASAIARAVAAVDPAARLDVRVQEKLVHIEGTAPVDELAQAIQEAGYTPRQVTAMQAPAPAPRSGGCCCASK